MSNYDDRNSTVRWIPGWVRNFLGLTADEPRASYSRYDEDRRQMAEKGVGWVPDPIRRWLGLDFSEPRRYRDDDAAYDRNVTYSSERPNLPPPPRQAALPPPPRPAALPSSDALPPPRPVASSEGPGLSFGARPGAEYDRYTTTDRPYSGAGPGAGPLPDGVQPIGYLLRSYARGALPPQGLESFTKDVRRTSTSVWDLYSYWIRFQTEELLRLGREFVDAVTDDTPPPAGSAGGPVKRIRVTAVNGNGETTTVETAPASPVPVEVAIADATDAATDAAANAAAAIDAAAEDAANAADDAKPKP